jgi:hypothetical protein
MTLQVTTTQQIPYETTVNQSKKRSRDCSPSKERISKKIKEIWTEQENTILLRILNTSFSNENLYSMRIFDKWKNLTDSFNKDESNTNKTKTKSQIYDKVNKLLIKENSSRRTFKELLEESGFTSTQSPIENYLTTQTAQASLSTTPEEKKTSTPYSKEYQIEFIENKFITISKSFSKGHLEGMQKYKEEKEKNGNHTPSISFLDFDCPEFYDLNLIDQFYNLGFSCAINRLIIADLKNTDPSLLYPDFSATIFKIDPLQCSLGIKDAKTAAKDSYQPTTPFTNLSTTLFQDSIQQQCYKLCFNKTIHKLNKEKKKKIDNLVQAWTLLESSQSDSIASNEEPFEDPEENFLDLITFPLDLDIT